MRRLQLTEKGRKVKPFEEGVKINSWKLVLNHRLEHKRDKVPEGYDYILIDGHIEYPVRYGNIGHIEE